MTFERCWLTVLHLGMIAPLYPCRSAGSIYTQEARFIAKHCLKRVGDAIDLPNKQKIAVKKWVHKCE